MALWGKRDELLESPRKKSSETLFSHGRHSSPPGHFFFDCSQKSLLSISLTIPFPLPLLRYLSQSSPFSSPPT